MTTTISGFIHYKDANTKEIYFESINIDSKTYILNKIKDDLNKYMITMDGSNNMIDGSQHIKGSDQLSEIIGSIDLNENDKTNAIATAQNSLIEKLKKKNFLNSIENSSLWVELKQNIETLKQLQQELLAVKNKIVESKIVKSIKLISTSNQRIISNNVNTSKEYTDIINFLFFMLKTENINLITIFNDCTLDVTNDLIDKCINNTGIINIDKVFFFTIIYNENEITDMHINNKSLHKALDLQEALDNNSNTIYGQLNSYINFLLKTDSTIDEKVTLIMDKFETTTLTTTQTDRQ